MTHDVKDPADTPQSAPQSRSQSTPSDTQGTADAPPSKRGDTQVSRWTLLGIGRAVFVAS